MDQALEDIAWLGVFAGAPCGIAALAGIVALVKRRYRIALGVAVAGAVLTVALPMALMLMAQARNPDAPSLAMGWMMVWPVAFAYLGIAALASLFLTPASKLPDVRS